MVGCLLEVKALVTHRRPRRFIRRPHEYVLTFVAGFLTAVFAAWLFPQLDDRLDNIGESVIGESLQVSVGATPAPPTAEEVERRAEVLSQEAILVGLAVGLCLRAPRIQSEWEVQIAKKFPEVEEAVGFVNLADYAMSFEDTRRAMELLDEFQKLLDELLRACR